MGTPERPKCWWAILRFSCSKKKKKANRHRPLKTRPFTVFQAFHSKAEVILFGNLAHWQHQLVPVQFLVNNTNFF